MRQAKVHVSIMGNETQQRLTLIGLQNSAGFLQRKVAEGIDTRYTPRLEFCLDKGVKNSLEVARILSQVLPPPVPLEITAAESSEDEAEEDEAEENEEIEAEADEE